MAERNGSEWRNTYERLDRLAGAAHKAEAEIPTPADISVGVRPRTAELSAHEIAEVQDRLSQIPQSTDDDRTFEKNNGRHKRAVSANRPLTLRQKIARVGLAAAVIGAIGAGGKSLMDRISLRSDRATPDRELKTATEEDALQNDASGVNEALQTNLENDNNVDGLEGISEGSADEVSQAVKDNLENNNNVDGLDTSKLE